MATVKLCLPPVRGAEQGRPAALRWSKVAKTESAALKLMAELGLAPEPPPVPKPVPLGQLRLPFSS